MIIKRFDKKKEGLAISQILILIIGIVAVSYALGSGVGVVSGLTINGEFTYGTNNIEFVIINDNKIVQKKNSGIQYIYDTDNPCRTKWFWDVDANGEWGAAERDRFDADLKVCMLEGFVTAMDDAKVPGTEDNICANLCDTLAGYDGGTCKTDCGADEHNIESLGLEGIAHGCPDKCCCYFTKEETAPGFYKGVCADLKLQNNKLLIEYCCNHFWNKALKYNSEEECVEKETKIYNDKAALARAAALTLPGDGTKKDRELHTNCAVLIRSGVFRSIEECCSTLQDMRYYSTEEECIKAESPPTEKEKKTDDEKEMVSILGGLLDVPKGGATHAIFSGFKWAGIVYGGVQTLGRILQLDVSLVNVASVALAAGFGLGKTIATWVGGKAGIGWGIGIGAVVSVGLFLALYKHETQEIITFTCYPWDADTGGNHCEECNKQGILPCSEYQCRSLGQSCELLNKGTDKEKCAWVNRNDVDFPRIEAWDDALLDEHEYVEQNTGIMPPDTGVKIVNKIGDECIKAFTPLSFGIITSDKDGGKEPAKCKIDILRKDNFDDMDFYFGGSSLFREEHTQVMSLPGSSALESEDITIENDGEYELYVRCQDANGNFNTANFVFKFCVEKGPDTTPPLIVGTTPLNGFPIAYNQTSIDIEVYINEPADCRWSHSDQSYDTMEDDTLHQMSCSSSVFEMNAQMLYRCSTTLTGLKSRQENKFYFRCKDESGNAKEESYKFSLIGTQPLKIDWIKPEEGSIIKDSTPSVKVTLEAKTSAGYNEGKSNCYFSDTGDEDDYVLFLGDGNYEQYQHSQDLWLPEKEGGYTYFIKCCDLGNNCDNKTANFEIDTDLEEPIVVRAYHEEKYLKLVTNEPARCVYDTKYENYPCDYSFDDGTSMTTIEDVNHYTDWNTQTTFYIICQDEYGNQPAYGTCSKIIRPFEVY